MQELTLLHPPVRMYRRRRHLHQGPSAWTTTKAVKTSVKQMNLRSFKLNGVCLDPLNMSNAGDFSWS